MNKKDVGSNPIFHTTVKEIICYLKKRFVFLHRNQNLILFIKRSQLLFERLVKDFMKTYNVRKYTHKPIWITSLIVRIGFLFVYN